MKRMHISVLRSLFGLLVALLVAGPTSAQIFTSEDRAVISQGATPLFEAIGEDVEGAIQSETLSGDQSENALRVMALRSTAPVQLVRLPERLSAHPAFEFGYNSDRGIVAETNPAGGGRVVAVRDGIEVLGDESYGWHGRLFVGERAEQEIGTVVLVQRQGEGVSGHLQVRTNLFEVHPLGDGLHILVDVDETDFPDDDHGEVDRDQNQTRGAGEESTTLFDPAAFSADGEREPAGAVRATCAYNTTDVLVAYTMAAANSVPNINHVIDEAILNSNIAYNRSGISSVRLRLADRLFLPSWGETGVIFNDIHNLSINSTLNQARNHTRADLVVVLTGAGAYNAAGIAIDILTPNTTTADDAYAIVDVGAAVSNRTFTHEVGHLQGAQHHPDDPVDPNRGFVYGRGHRQIWSQCVPGFGWICGYHRFATIMAYRGQNFQYPRINNLSNPNRQVQGKATGTSMRDNARVVRETGSIVSRFRTPNDAPSLNASMSVVSGDQITGFYTMRANACGGEGGYTYEWRLQNETESSYGPVLSTQAEFSTTVPVGDNLIKLRVNSASGESVARVGTLYRWPRLDCGPGEILCPIPQDRPFASSTTRTSNIGIPEAGLFSQGEATPETFTFRSVSPNPVRDRAVVLFDLPETSDVQVGVYDLLGREVMRVERDLGAGVHRLPLSLKRLPAGVYIVQIQAAGHTASREITLLR